MNDHLPQSDADWVAGILAITGEACGGVLLADAACASFIAASIAAQPFKAVPPSITSDYFTGTIDLAATLALGKPVRTAGLFEHGGMSHLLIRRADALDVIAVSQLAHMLDEKTLVLAAVSELQDQDVVLSQRLSDRLAFRIDTDVKFAWSAHGVAHAREFLAAIRVEPKHAQDLCEVAIALGVASPRSVLQACHAAQAIAALRGLTAVDEASLALAARLVFAHRATRIPDVETETQPPADQEKHIPPDQNAEQRDRSTPSDSEVVLDAVRAAMPVDLLQQLAGGLGKRASGRNSRNAVAAKAKSTRGRRIGSRRSASLAGQRLDVIATLRNAAPWQVLRRRVAASERMIVTRDDFQVHRIKQRNEAVAIFAVDASGSTAFQRLAEAKGAVEAILAECYVRRDKVALVSFRSKMAEELLPPTRSLERAKRALTALPGGGGTPLASGLDAAFRIAEQVRRGGATPIIVVLTDGRANVTRDGEGNKAKAMEETAAAARLFAAEGMQAMVIDVSPEPQRQARTLAENMGGTYFAMPRGQSGDIARPVSAAMRQRA